MSHIDRENDINRIIKKLGDRTAGSSGTDYFKSLLDNIVANLNMASGFIYNINENNTGGSSLLSSYIHPDNPVCDHSDLDPVDFIRNHNGHNCCISNNVPEILTQYYQSYVSYLILDEHHEITGLIILLSFNKINDEEMIFEVIESQIPRATSELVRLHINKKLNRIEKSYNNLIDSSLDAVWETDKIGKITKINASCKAIYGHDDQYMKGRHYHEFMFGLASKEFDVYLAMTQNGESLYSIQADHLTRDNETIKVCYNMLPKFDENNNIIGAIGTTRDISASVRAQQTIKDNSELFSSILSRLPVIFFRVDENGYLIDIRGNGLKRMGVDDLDWVGKPGYGLFLGMDEKINSALSGNTVFFENKGTYKSKPWWFFTSMFFDNWSGYGAVGFSVDITEQKLVEEQLVELLKNNRILAQRLVEVQEDERRNLARELHDELGQSITAIKSLATVITAGADSQLNETINLAGSIIELSGHLYEVVNNIMQRLRPDIIDGLEFKEAIQNCIVRSQLETVGVSCVLTIDGNIDDLDEVVKITIYRIVQECLTNISKHAMASNVNILIQRETENSNLRQMDECNNINRRDMHNLSAHRDTIKIDINDDGIGMNVKNKLNNYKNAKRHGLQGINERITAMGGKLEISSSKGKGVHVHAVFILGNNTGKISKDITNKITEIKNMRYIEHKHKSKKVRTH